ncbi:MULTISPECIES: D-TA family PLP-dependent enzyme [Chitinophagaceae]
MEWFEIEHAGRLDTPSLAIYKNRMEQNIDSFIGMCADTNRLRPHVKTNKIKEVCQVMMQKGITRFKSATLAELEMLCSISVPDVLLAYPLVGANINHFIGLQKQYPKTQLSFLVDNDTIVPILEKAFSDAGLTGNIFIDVNVGMNRTGCKVENIAQLFTTIKDAKHLSALGFHAYDGHIHDGNPQERCAVSKQGTNSLRAFKKQLEEAENKIFQLVIGGSPTFACYLDDEDVQLSPGTFVFWDYSYKTHYPELPFDYAALVLTRIISILDEQHICLDLGHKAVASEMTQPRVSFLNLNGTTIVSQSEEHLVVRVPDTSSLHIGTVIYAVPIHICPTVSLYDKANIIENNQVIGQWDIVARKRFLTTIQ